MRTSASLILSSVFCLSIAFAQDAQPPFWKKPEVYRRIENDRYIAVSAKTEKKAEVYEMRVVTAGHIAAPAPSVYEELMKFENYPQVTSHFKSVRYDTEKKQLFLHGEAVGFHAQMLFQLDIRGDAQDRTIAWRVIHGTFEGMKGEILLKSVSPPKTEISMWGEFQSVTLPLPRLLMGVGLEIVAHRVAGLMRTHLEKKHGVGR